MSLTKLKFVKFDHISVWLHLIGVNFVTYKAILKWCIIAKQKIPFWSFVLEGLEAAIALLPCHRMFSYTASSSPVGF